MSVDALSNILAAIHEGIALVSQTPEMALDKSEADLLASAAVPVLEQFNIAPDPRFAAAFALIAACGTVYVPRALLIRQRIAAQGSNRRAANARPLNPDFQTGGFADFGNVN